MNIKKLAVFGDSWVYGDELIDPTLEIQECCSHLNTNYRLNHSFSGLLAKELGVPYENYGHPGGSLQSAIWTFLWFLDNTDWSDTVCVIGLTGSDRQSWFNPEHKHMGDDDPQWNKLIHSTWVNFGSDVVPKVWQDFGKQYLTLSHDSQLSLYNYQQAVYFFDGIAKTKNIPLVQFNLYNPETVITGCDTLLWPEQNMKDKLLNRHDANKIHAPLHHPNELGHQIISKELLPKVNDAILT